MGTSSKPGMVKDGTRISTWIVRDSESYLDNAGRYYDLYSMLSSMSFIRKHSHTITKYGCELEVDNEVGSIISDYMNGRKYGDMELEEYLHKLFSNNE